MVKELVENALDAGARTIDVHVEEGGCALVRVADDGDGMDRDDAVMAIARHATSKIRDAADLVSIGSFGFRGEALAAICSVARMEILTATSDGDGTLVRAAAGALTEVEPAARRRGTTVSVARLFHNTPARQKFLRGPRSEWRAVNEAVITAGLVRRDVRFDLTHDSRRALTLPPASSLRVRLAAMWGGAYADSLLDVDDVQGVVHVSGLVERPADVGTRARRAFLMVNGRAVRDSGITRAVEAAFRSTIPGGGRPSYFLDLVLPADLVDVNVHPAKAELRFHDRWPVERVVEEAVRRALGTVGSSASFGRFQPGATSGMTLAQLSASGATDDVSILRAGTQPTEGLFAPAPDEDASSPTSPRADTPESLVGMDGADGAEPGVPPVTTPVEDDLIIPPLIQLRRTWMLYEDADGVTLIDQHSAHERVLYEQFMGALDGGEVPSQRLLFPLTLHLGPAEADAFEEHRALFERLGYEVEGFGGHTLLVRSVPAPHRRFDAERCLRESLDDLTGARQVSSAAGHEQLAATIACKAAIKAGDILSQDEMRALFAALARTRLAPHDVHGRSTIVRLSWEELERRFGRR